MIVAKSCLTLCDPMDCSLPGSCVHGILQARIWSGLPFPSPGDLPHPGIEHKSPALQPDSSPSEPLWKSLSLLRSLISRVSFCCVFLWPLGKKAEGSLQAFEERGLKEMTTRVSASSEL